MKKVESGDRVKLCYRGKLEGEQGFDPDGGCQEVEIQIGAGEILKGFENSILGMASNEKKVFTLNPEEAYGQRHSQLVRTFGRSDLPSDFDVEAGEVVALQTNRGDQILATVKALNGDNVTLDMNHPLAGKSLTFEVEIEEIHTAQE